MTDYKNIDTSPKADFANWTLRVIASAATLVLFYGSLIWAAS
jgi:hypothetical protein